jgi:para-nitrobenzyl esterase
MQMGLKAACALAMTVLVFGLAATVHADSLTVKTEQGKATGKTINDGKVKAFLGLPYAAPPSRRSALEGARAARQMEGRARCDQIRRALRAEPRFRRHDLSGCGPSEDCLFLNVYAPAGRHRQKQAPSHVLDSRRRVLRRRQQFEPRHNGDFLPLKGVVLVTINYRLRRLRLPGYRRPGQRRQWRSRELWPHGHGRGPPMGQCQHQEFRRRSCQCHHLWRKRRLLRCQHADGFSSAQGLFEKPSGRAGRIPGRPEPPGDTLGGAKKDDEPGWIRSASSRSELRAMPTDQASRSSEEANSGRLPPDVDGKLLTQPVPDTYAAGKQAHVPLLAGWNRDEGSFLGNAGYDRRRNGTAWQMGCSKSAPPSSSEALSSGHDTEALRSAIDFGGDNFIAFSTWKWLEAHRKDRRRARLSLPLRARATAQQISSRHVRLSLRRHRIRLRHPGHTARRTVRPEDRKLSDEMMSYWTNFAKNGDPNGPGLPSWPKYGADDALIHLNDPITAGPDTLRARYEFLLKECRQCDFERAEQS